VNTNAYPNAVNSIVNDYLQRLDSHLSGLAALERRDFVREIESHIFESYATEAATDDVDRVLRVLRRLGEPAAVVEDRLSDSLVRSGSRHRTILRIAAGVLIALFGVPLGIGGVAALFGFLVALGGILVSYFAFASALVISGILMIALGASRIYLPGLWDRMVETGILQIDSDLERVLALGDAGTQGYIILLAGCALVAAAFGLFYFGRKLFRGISNLALLLLDRARKAAQSIRKYWSNHGNPVNFRHVAQRI
jgi:uncharacterized membrane protein